jgi:hypothetical protein
MEADLNPWAILVAAAATFVLGGVWYSPLLFARPWMRAAGLSEEEAKSGSPAKIFGGAFLLAVLMAANLAAFLGKDPSVGWGAAAGALAAVWVVAAFGVVYLFERRPMTLLAINGGYQVVALTLMGAILAAWP